MQKFRFRLDSVLRLRTLQLTVEREKLGCALGEATAAEQALTALAAERAAAVAFVQNETGTGTTELHALSDYLLGYEPNHNKLRISLEAARLRVTEQRKRVVAADRAERLLLKLKADRLAEWQLAADHELETLAQESWNAVHFNHDA
jgi:flagellar export protein FliJ